MLPRKVLLVTSPIIAAAVVATVTSFIARRVWRYPVFLIGATGGVWVWAHPDSFARMV
jgi:hypothetical protein